MNLTYLRLIKKVPKLFKKLRLTTLEKSVQNYYQNLLLRYLYKQNSYLFDCTYQSKTASSDTIWVCWLQGIENAPDIVQSCISSIQQQSSNVSVIDINNYSKYVDIPDYIVDKFNKNIITPTHFSDILRFALLANHGGTWIDSTYLILEKIPEPMLANEFFTLSSDNTKFKQWVPEGKWSGNFIKFSANHSAPKIIFECFLNYWKYNNYLIDYFLIDYLIKLNYLNNQEFKQHIDNNIAIGDNIFLLAQMILEPINNKNNKLLEQDNIKIYKLSHRIDTQSMSITGTYYEKYILNR